MVALSSRIALGVAMPVGPVAGSLWQQTALERLQAAMTLCRADKGNSKLPAVPSGERLEDLLVFQYADDDHALHSAPVCLRSVTARWEFWRANHPAAGFAPKIVHAAWHARAPPLRALGNSNSVA